MHAKSVRGLVSRTGRWRWKLVARQAECPVFLHFFEKYMMDSWFLGYLSWPATFWKGERVMPHWPATKYTAKTICYSVVKPIFFSIVTPDSSLTILLKEIDKKILQVLSKELLKLWIKGFTSFLYHAWFLMSLVGVTGVISEWQTIVGLNIFIQWVMSNSK